jgi:hypothetical protein
MSLTSKTSSLQAYNMVLYHSAIHPEFFSVSGRQRIQHGPYEFEAWVFRGGHVLRFELDKLCVTEVVSDQIEKLPQKGLVTALPCAGEKDHECEFTDHVTYMTSIQTETLTDHLYLSTYNELVEHSRMSESLMTAWHDAAGRHNLSLLDTQKFNDQIHVQTYHCRSDCSLVLRTQTIFQVNEK